MIDIRELKAMKKPELIEKLIKAEQQIIHLSQANKDFAEKNLGHIHHLRNKDQMVDGYKTLADKQKLIIGYYKQELADATEAKFNYCSTMDLGLHEKL